MRRGRVTRAPGAPSPASTSRPRGGRARSPGPAPGRGPDSGPELGGDGRRGGWLPGTETGVLALVARDQRGCPRVLAGSNYRPQRTTRNCAGENVTCPGVLAVGSPAMLPRSHGALWERGHHREEGTQDEVQAELHGRRAALPCAEWGRWLRRFVGKAGLSVLRKVLWRCA